MNKTDLLCFRCQTPHCLYYDKNHRGMGAEVECSTRWGVRHLVVDECEFFKEREHVKATLG